MFSAAFTATCRFRRNLLACLNELIVALFFKGDLVGEVAEGGPDDKLLGLAGAETVALAGAETVALAGGLAGALACPPNVGDMRAEGSGGTLGAGAGMLVGASLAGAAVSGAGVDFAGAALAAAGATR